MSQLHGKQLKNTSVVLDKLSGTGVVTFTDSASMSFAEGAVLRTHLNNILVGQDVVNKEYVDSVASGLDVKQAADLYQGTNIALTGHGGGLTVDGISATDGDRIVLNGQTLPEQNGIYVFNSGDGELTRATDFDSGTEVQGGEFVFIKKGNNFADTGWVVSTPDTQAVIGTDAIAFTQFSSAGVILAGVGLEKDGNTLNVLLGTGLTTSGTNNPISIDATGVSANSYGSADTVPTFTVNAQGQLTLAQDVTIDIVSTQVNDFDTAVSNEVFDAANFVDSDTIDFTVTAGESVTADVVAGTAIGTDAGGVYVKFDNDTIVLSGDSLAVDVSAIAGAGLTGNGTDLEVLAGNGLTVANDRVELGGTLDSNTTVSGDSSYSMTFNGLTDFTVVSVDMDATLTGDLTLSAQTATYTSGDGTGIQYAADYTGGFVANSLVTKQYVDDATTATTYFADQGLTMSGNTFSVLVDSAALEINGSNEVSLKSTITGDRTFSNNIVISGDLTVNGTTTTVNTEELLVEDNVITLNSGEAGASVTAGSAGIEVDRGSSAFAKVLFDDSDDLWYAGLSGSLHAVVTEAGDGLTQSGNVLSLDASFVAGVGLTPSAGGSSMDVVAGNGLTADAAQDRVKLGGTLDENTEINAAYNNLTVGTALGIVFNTAGEGSTGIELEVKSNGDLSLLTSATSDIILDSGAAVSVDAAGAFSLSFSNGTVTSGNSEGLVYSEDYSSTFVNNSLITKQYVDDIITDIQANDLDEIVAGDGLTGGGTSGNVTLAVGDGAGISVAADSIAVEITAAGGLTFSESGATGTLEIAYDPNTLTIVDGQLKVLAGSAQPVYQVGTPSSTYAGTNGTGAETNITLSSTPNDYSRIEVYVNGQKQTLSEGTSSDCWFGTSSTATALASLASGATLVWNAASAGFSLDTGDKVEIVYEA